MLKKDDDITFRQTEQYDGCFVALSSLQGKAGLQQKGAKFAHENLFNLPKERREEWIEGDTASDPVESDEVLGEPAVLDPENKEVE